MRIKQIAAFALVLTALLGGCQKPASQAKESSSASASQVSKKSEAESSSSEASSSSSTSTDQVQAATTRIAELNKKLTDVLGKMPLPQADGLGAGSDHLNIRYAQTDTSKTIYYSVGDQAEAFNAASLQNEYPYATLTETTYANNDAAAGQVNYQQNAAGLPTADLGSGVTGTIDAGAGQRYLHWNKGQWSFLVHAAAVNGEDPVATGKQIVTWANQYALPDARGAAELEVGTSFAALNQKFTWQVGNKIYQVQAHSAETAMKMIASMKTE